MDSWARVVIPAVYLLALIILFNVELTDKYDSNEDVPMYMGLGPARLSQSGPAWISTLSVFAVIVGVLWLHANKVAAKDKRSLEDEQRAASRERLENFASSVRVSTGTPVNDEESETSYRAPSANPRRERVAPDLGTAEE